MVERKKIQLPKVPKPVAKVGAKAQKSVLKLEKRLVTFTQRQLIALAVAVGFFSLLAGLALGFFLNPYRSIPTPDVDLTTPSTTSSPETISQSGVLRKFQTSQDGIDFYLEKQDNTKVLLKTTGQIDSSLLEEFKGLAVTIEGTVTKSADGSKDILQIEKIVLKR